MVGASGSQSYRPLGFERVEDAAEEEEPEEEHEEIEDEESESVIEEEEHPDADMPDGEARRIPWHDSPPQRNGRYPSVDFEDDLDEDNGEAGNMADEEY